jgi:hypothetical protein
MTPQLRQALFPRLLLWHIRELFRPGRRSENQTRPLSSTLFRKEFQNPGTTEQGLTQYFGGLNPTSNPLARFSVKGLTGLTDTLAGRGR